MMLDTFVLAFLTLNETIQIWHIVITSLVLGIASAFEITARQAMLIELVAVSLYQMPSPCNPQHLISHACWVPH